MSERFNFIKKELYDRPKSWLVTGVAGFIGSNLLEFLLKLNQHVVGLDNFSTGFRTNLEEVRAAVTPDQWANFTFLEGDIRDIEMCIKASRDIDYVLHQAALGSVPRSVDDPITTNASNVTGFLNMMVAARDAKVSSFVYAASSSTYGDSLDLPKVEDKIGKPLSPYAVTKLVNELYADVFKRTYDFNSIGLRYFNVFGKRQNPNGAYAAVIPKWIGLMVEDTPITIHGDGETSRDFCFIENTIQANILAACAQQEAQNQIYNVALNERTSLKELFHYIKSSLLNHDIAYTHQPIYSTFRKGDVRHSQADISKIKNFLGYEPLFKIGAGIDRTVDWYVEHCAQKATA